MKVLHVFHELKFSGAEIMYVDASRLFQMKGCELSALATSENLGEFAPFFLAAGYKVLHRPYPSFKNYLSRIHYYFKFIQLLKHERYDVLHIHSAQTMWGLAFCAWVAGVKSVYTFHNVFASRSLTYLYHCLLRWSAKNIFKCCFQTISDSVYNNELKLFHNHTTKIYNWYGSSRYFPATSAERIKARNELNISQDAFVLISVGGCSATKRHSEIIKALPKVLESGIKCLYLHLGRGCTEDEESMLAFDLGVQPNVRFCGNQTDVRKFLIAADIYLMTSKFEGIPITTIEALACCVPAILYDVPGLRDFNASGENCLIIPESYQLLAEKIIYLYKSPDFGINLSKNAKVFVDNAFSMEKNSELVYNLYKQDLV